MMKSQIRITKPFIFKINAAFYCYFNSQHLTAALRAWSRSAMMSSAFSRPTLSLTRFSVTPRATRSFSSMEA